MKFTPEQLEHAFGNTDFNKEAWPKVIFDTLLKYACGYGTGKMSTGACVTLGLVQHRRNTSGHELTQEGKAYLYDEVQKLRANTYPPLPNPHWT